MAGAGDTGRSLAALGVCLACAVMISAAEAGCGDDLKSLEAALERHARVLAVDIGERSPLRGDGLDRAEAFVRDALAGAGLAVEDQVYEFNGRRVANLIATVPGGPPGDAYVVVGAHYDTVPGTPGADDNGAAVAVLIELGRRLVAQPPAVPVRLVAFTLEEPPAFATRHQGSRVFVRRLKDRGERVRGAIVLEMVGFTAPVQEYPFVVRWMGYPSTGDYIGVVGNWGSRAFGRAVIRGFKRNPGLPVESLFLPFNGWVIPDSRLSDHASFWDKGLPAVMVTDTAYFRNPNYHGPTDRLETLDFAFMAQLVCSLEFALEELAAQR